MALTPSSPISRVRSLTYIPTNSSLVSVSIPRANRRAYLRAVSRFSSDAEIDSLIQRETSLHPFSPRSLRTTLTPRGRGSPPVLSRHHLPMLAISTMPSRS